MPEDINSCAYGNKTLKEDTFKESTGSKSLAAGSKSLAAAAGCKTKVSKCSKGTKGSKCSSRKQNTKTGTKITTLDELRMKYSK